jgi:hypothetical protein
MLGLRIKEIHMVAEIIQLRPKQPLLAGYRRVGHNGQKRLQGMLASGKLQHRRFVMGASHLHEQTELLSAFRKAEREVILDTNFAEMFFEGKFQRLQDALVDLNDKSGASYSRVPHFRGGQSKISAILAG